MRRIEKHLINIRWGNVVILHQGHEIVRRQIINGKPHDENDDRDGQDVNTQELPQKTTLHRINPHPLSIIVINELVS